MFVSFVVATYNCAELVPILIDTAKRLQELDCEFCITDGGSDDGTVELLQASPAVRLVQSGPDNGIYDAWNKALPFCGGEYLSFIGVDDVPQADFISHAMKLCSEADQSPAFVYGDRYLRRKHKTRLITSPERPLLFEASEPVFDVPHQGALNHKRLFEKRAFGKHYRLAGDLEFYIGVRDLILKYGYRYVALPQVVADAEGVSRSASSYGIYLKEFRQIEAEHNINLGYSKIGYRTLSLFEYAPALFKLGQEVSWKFRHG